jgi:hypothetical protein
MVSAGTTSGNVQTLAFPNSNGVSFGLNGSTITASHNGYTGATTQWLTTAQPPGAYLTTAMLSAEPHIRAIVYSDATQTSGSLVLSGSNGITIRSAANTAIIEFDGHHLDAFVPSGNGFGTGFSSMTSGTVGLVAGSNVSFSQNGNALTIQALTNALTTAAQVSHSHGNGSLALTNLTGTTASASNGWTISLSAAAAGGGGVGLNTAATNVTWTVNTSGISLNAGGYAGTGTSGTNATFTLNSAGLALNAGAYLTTAAGVSHTHGAGPTLTGPIAATSASNGLSLNVNAIGNTTAATNVTWTVGTNGLSLNAGGYAGTTTGATNATFTLNSLGLALSVAAPGGGGGVAVAGSGASTVTSGTMQFANLNGISFGLNGSTMTASYSSNHSHGNPTLALTNLSGTTASASNGFTLSLAAAAPGGGSPVAGYWAVPPWGYGSQSNALLTNITGISRRFIFMPFQVANSLSFGELHWPMSRSTNGSNAFSMFMGVYSHVNSSSLQTVWSTSVAYSATATASVSGLRGFEATFASTSLSPGQYVLGLMFDPIGGSTSAMNYSLMGAATGNSMLQTQVVNGSNAYHTSPAHMWLPFHGRYSVTSAAVPANVVATDIIAQGNASAVPLPMYWALGTHYGA